MWYLYLLSGLGVFAALQLLVDINYFLRMGVVYVRGRYFRKRVHVLETTKYTGEHLAYPGYATIINSSVTNRYQWCLDMGIEPCVPLEGYYVLAKILLRETPLLMFTALCLTSDVDYLLSHMNNARFLRELDFARADFYQRTGLYRAIQAKGGAVVQGAATIRYRKFVRLCSIYTILSKVIYWEGPSIYMEHRFISPGDDFVLAIAICKQRLLKVESEDLMREIMSEAKCPEAAGTYAKPELPMDLAKWIEANEISSANLRNGC